MPGEMKLIQPKIYGDATVRLRTTTGTVLDRFGWNWRTPLLCLRVNCQCDFHQEGYTSV